MEQIVRALLVLALPVIVASGPLVGLAGSAATVWKWFRRPEKRTRMWIWWHPGFVVPATCAVFELLLWLRAGSVVTDFWPSWFVWGNERDPIVAAGRRRWRERFIEAHVVVGAVLAIGVLAVLPFFSWVREESWFRIYVCIVVGYRLAEIFVTAWNVHVFDRLRRHGGVASEKRQFILNVVNYGEVVLLFATLWTVIGTGVERSLTSTWEALEHSLRIAALMGPLDRMDAPVDRVLFVSETAMMFITFVLIRAVSAIRPRQ